uniref:BTB domain-containing protein n=1 Tax=Caenorhabditis tropicalis TaxID=1561998 RepID=A0A1I7UFX0_9PELO
MDFRDARKTLEYAQKYKVSNVIQLVDQALRFDPSLFEVSISKAISYGLNHYLADLLRKQESLEELAEELKKVNLETMSGEIMKKCVKFFIEH